MEHTYPDRAELDRIATAAMKAIIGKDASALIDLVPPEERADAALDLAPGGRAHEMFFGETEWRYQAAATWTGSFAQARMRDSKDGTRVRLVFGEYQGKTASIELADRDGTWYFKDLRKRDISQWGEALG